MRYLLELQPEVLPKSPSGAAATGHSLAAMVAARRRRCCEASSLPASGNGVEPFAWFRDVLSRIPAHSITRLSELLPHNWAPAPDAITASGRSAKVYSGS